jgi:hypothetical protein
MNRLWSVNLPALISIAVLALSSGILSADVEIISPTAGSEVSGVVQVTARVTPPKGHRIQKVIAQAENGQSVELVPGEPDMYSAKLDTIRLPNGKQSLLVIESVKGVDASRSAGAEDSWESTIRIYDSEVLIRVRNPYHFYFGDLHSHTSYSDGVGTPKEAYEYARDKSKLDFFAVTDHSQLLTFDEYADVIAQANKFDDPGKFAALYGAESTEGTGHMNFYFAPVSRLSGVRDEIYQSISRLQVLAQFNHPNVKSPPDQGWTDDYEGFHYSPAADRFVALAEVRYDKEEEAYIALLDHGWHVGAASNDDTHSADWGKSNWTAALARELTRAGIVDAIAGRRTYSSGDRNFQLTFTLDGEDMGSQLTRRAGSYDAMVEVYDPDADQVIDTLDLFLDGKIVATEKPKLTKYAWAVPVKLDAGRHYVFVRVTHAGGKQSWSSPIWVSAY